MTFKDLQRLVQSDLGGQSENNQLNQLLSKLRNKPFWIWERPEHKLAAATADRTRSGADKDNGNGDYSCCFNHIIGLPAKDGIRKPLFEYERILYNALERPGYLNSKPPTSTGIGRKNPSSPTAKSIEVETNNIAHPFKIKHLWIKKATGLGVTEFFLRYILLDNVRRTAAKKNVLLPIIPIVQPWSFACVAVTRMHHLRHERKNPNWG